MAIRLIRLFRCTLDAHTVTNWPVPNTHHIWAMVQA
ncbi:hypothetical protein ZHAWSFBX_CDS_0015 [Agrobacterium phage Alfirin]|nr:hypothetical protein ZHAWSFBX_CDS_0015 [Agrobacterium phage Alfirin]